MAVINNYLGGMGAFNSGSWFNDMGSIQQQSGIIGQLGAQQSALNDLRGFRTARKDTIRMSTPKTTTIKPLVEELQDDVDKWLPKL